MSKGRVWNRGKHDGTGLSKKKPVVQEETESNEAGTTADNSNEISNSRIDTVKPMNRENWVSRPKRVINKDPKQQQ